MLKRTSFGRRIAAGLAGVAVIMGLGSYAFVNAARFLESPAQAPVRSDAAFVLGGGFGDREIRAAELHRDGLTAQFVLMGMEDFIGDMKIDYIHWRVRVLERGGVAQSAIILDGRSSSSDDEAAYGLRLARERGWRRVMVVSDPPHMRRLSILWGRAFAGSGVEVVLVATRPRWWSPDRWWSSRKSANFVVQENIKLVYTLFNLGM
ncbi:MAG: YdcF family protein [Betaproteobacteria bacterium]|nr:YdcF family protein [Betaproteobacteria bacterium]